MRIRTSSKRIVVTICVAASSLAVTAHPNPSGVSPNVLLSSAWNRVEAGELMTGSGSAALPRQPSRREISVNTRCTRLIGPVTHSAVVVVRCAR